MRNLVKNTLASLALYLAAVVGMAIFIEAELWTFVMVAFTGFVVLVVLGGLLHLQLRRSGANLTGFMEAAAKGEAKSFTARGDEFPEVRHAARRLGDELKAARKLAVLAEIKLNAVANAFEVGVILIGPPGAPVYMNESAKRILTADRPGDFVAHFTELRVKLGAAIDRLCRPDGMASTARIEVIDAACVGRRLRIELRALGAGDREECLLIIKDRDLIDAMDKDLLAAARARSLSRLHAATAHDLKAPLNAMSLQLELLRRGLDAADTAVSHRQRHHLSVLSEEMKRLNRRLSSMLEQSAPTADGRKAFELGTLIDDIITLLAPQARGQQVKLDVNAAKHPVTVFGDAAQIKQALLNVMLNALECVSDGGRVNVLLSADSSSASVVIRDDGPGMPAASLDRIFDMHFTTKETGTGIGLYVARAVTENHGGEIRVESRLGAGSAFTISLPLLRISGRAEA